MSDAGVQSHLAMSVRNQIVSGVHTEYVWKRNPIARLYQS